MVVDLRRGASGAIVLVALLAWLPAAAWAQTLSLVPSGDAVRVRAPDWSFLNGEPLVRLKDGRAIRVELVMTALAAPGRSPITAVSRIFSLSYDLWEERFAVTITGTRAASMSHQTVAAAEAWSLEQLAMPIASLGSMGDARFWIRLDCRILDGDGASRGDESEGLTLQRIIDVLSRRKKGDAPARTVEGGPFRVPPRGGAPAPSR